MRCANRIQASAAASRKPPAPAPSSLPPIAPAFLAGTLVVADYVVRRRLYKTFWFGLGLAVLLDVAIKFPLAPEIGRDDYDGRLTGVKSE